MVRSRFVTHWTGKDIQTIPEELTNSLRSEYLERLADILGAGMWMTVPGEELTGWSRNGKGSKISLQVPMTCFTELRLSSSSQHTRSYGLLGLVFDRSFVVERGGGPVHYLRSHRNDPIIGNLAQVLAWVKDQQNRGTDFAQEIQDMMFYNIGFMKGMSEPDSDDFTYLDENEWRIIHNHLQERANRLVATDLDKPRYRVPFERKDLKMVILPDEETRTAAMRDERISIWLDNALPLLTVDEVRNF